MTDAAPTRTAADATVGAASRGPSVWADLLSGDPGPRWRFAAAGGCALLGIAAAVAERCGAAGTMVVLVAAAYLAGGLRATLEAISAMQAGKLEINFLMVLVAVVSAALGHWDEGAILLFLFSLSDALERFAVERTRRGVSRLMDLRPRTACLVRDGVESTVPLEALRVDDRIRVRPGERFAADGEVETGSSAADESIVTGEGLPVDKQPGSPIFAGTFNANGSLLVRVTRAAADSTLARIVHLVENAQENKLGAQRLIERWQGRYVLAVLVLSAVTMVAKWITGALDGEPLAAIRPAIQTGMILLVAASPCALVLATPVVVLAAVTRGARFGVLFKGGSHLEHLAGVSTLAFDKTGTLTRGKPTVADVQPVGGATVEALLTLAAGLESHSEHPLARAVVRAAAARSVQPAAIEDFQREPGTGVWGRVAGQWVGVGAPELFARHGHALPPELAAAGAPRPGQIRVVVWGAAGIGGVLTLRDELRPEAAATLARLRELGIQHLALLTGDHPAAAGQIAEALDIRDVRASLKPEDKLFAIRRLAKQNGGVAMIGDGVNDAPALAAATVGVAMGAAGSDVAMETADVVLMRDDLRGLTDAVNLARRSRTLIAENLALGGGMIALLICLTLLGALWLPVAVICHEGSTVLVVLNGLRLLREPSVAPA